MEVNVRHSIGDLAADLTKIPPAASRDLHGVVRDGLRVGNNLARDFARESAGKHGKHYPKAFTTEMNGTASGLTGGGLISGEYGPDPALPQGGMSFEYGSRNQKPHLDLARSADIIGPSFAGEVRRASEQWFWL